MKTRVHNLRVGDVVEYMPLCYVMVLKGVVAELDGLQVRIVDNTIEISDPDAGVWKSLSELRAGLN